MAKYRMTAAQAFKKRFVERSLGPMASEATKGFAKRASYGARGDSEWVDVEIALPPWELRVDVAGLGLWDLAYEVMDAIDEKFEQ